MGEVAARMHGVVHILSSLFDVGGDCPTPRGSTAPPPIAAGKVSDIAPVGSIME